MNSGRPLQRCRVYPAGMAQHAAQLEKAINEAMAEGWSVVQALSFSSGLVMIVYERSEGGGGRGGRGDGSEAVEVECTVVDSVDGRPLGLPRGSEGR